MVMPQLKPPPVPTSPQAPGAPPMPPESPQTPIELPPDPPESIGPRNVIQCQNSSMVHSIEQLILHFAAGDGVSYFQQSIG